ncbi:ethionine resistance protein, partial [Coemansia sp. RSA 2675]
MAPTFGLLSAMDTFCSTAFTASCDKTLVGFHYQRGLIAVFSHILLVAPILWNAESILLVIKQDPGIAALCGKYLRIQILGILPFSVFETTRRYLQAQGIMRAGMIVASIVAPIHWFGNYFLVRSPTYGLGFIGAPIANVLSNCLMCAGIIIYACNSRAVETWGGWDLSAFRNMSQYYRLAIPAVFTVCAEWVAYELLIIGSSYFGANQMAGQAIMINSIVIIFQFSYGLGFGTTPRIGNLIGAAKPRQARIAADMSLAATVLIGIVCTLFLVFFGDWWTSVYTSDPVVAHEAAKLRKVACMLITGNGTNAVLGAILRGLGRQQVSANMFIFSFYVCAVPIGAYLGYGLQMQALAQATGPGKFGFGAYFLAWQEPFAYEAKVYASLSPNSPNHESFFKTAQLLWHIEPQQLANRYPVFRSKVNVRIPSQLRFNPNPGQGLYAHIFVQQTGRFNPHPDFTDPYLVSSQIPLVRWSERTSKSLDTSSSDTS